MEALNVLLRWLHITSAALLAGGMIYARMVIAPEMAALPPDLQRSFADRTATRFRPLVVLAMIGLAVSGTYNLLNNPGHSPLYHSLLGVKILLALHVFGVGIMIAGPSASPERAARRPRMMVGVAISALAIILISAYLRRIF